MSELAKVCLRLKQEDEGVRAGNVVRLTKEWHGLPVGSLGIISGSRHRRLYDCSIIFQASAFRDDKVVSCSGGPGTITTSCSRLIPTGETHLTWYWRWKDGHACANNSESYAMNSFVWEWDGSDE